MTYSFPLRVNNLLVWSIWLEFNDMPSGFVSTPTPAPRNPSLSPTWRTDSSNIIYIIYIQAMHKISALTVTSSLKKPTVSWLILYSSSQTNMNISVHFSSSFSSSARTKPICFSWRTHSAEKTAWGLNYFKRQEFLFFFAVETCMKFHVVLVGFFSLTYLGLSISHQNEIKDSCHKRRWKRSKL